ncbi:MAG: DUF1800 domain-containing protein [Pseudomonadota bacterium]|nr:DUF1800 domain-containing protein [Pseudomonadota bacterium]
MIIARGGAGFALAAAAMLAQAAPAQLSAAQARHLLLRTGFAPAQAEVDRLVGQSAERTVADIIAKAQTVQPVHPPPAFVAAPAPSPPRLLETREQRQEWRRRQLAEGLELKTWWVREMIDSPTPLAERMTLFWHGHFATSQQKVVLAQAMWRQQQLLRARGLGSFRALLHGIGKDPAMLAYLDGAISRKEAPNENFAREVMELFTLGEATQGGGYSEQDIREAARAFTGWSIDRDDFSFRMRPAFHDDGTKTVFGRSGNFDGDAVLDLLLEQPAAARFLTARLWREFVSPAPEGPEFEAIAARFRSSEYDIASVLRELLLSDAFWAEGNRGSLVKSPVELVVGAVRQFGLSPPDTTPLVRKSAQLGQNLLLPPNVKGWPGYNDWIDATRLLERKRFAEQLFRAMDTMANQPRWAETFLAVYGGHADREPDAAVQARLSSAMLALPPTQPVAAGTVGVAWLRSLMLDAAYQLK